MGVPLGSPPPPPQMAALGTQCWICGVRRPSMRHVPDTLSFPPLLPQGPASSSCPAWRASRSAFCSTASSGASRRPAAPLGSSQSCQVNIRSTKFWPKTTPCLAPHPPAFGLQIQGLRMGRGGGVCRAPPPGMATSLLVQPTEPRGMPIPCSSCPTEGAAE